MSPQTASLMEIKLNNVDFAEQHCQHSRATRLSRLMHTHAVCRGVAESPCKDLPGLVRSAGV